MLIRVGVSTACLLFVTLIVCQTQTTAHGTFPSQPQPPNFHSPHEPIPAPVPAHPLTTPHPHGEFPQPQPQPTSGTVQLPVYVPVEQITDKIITNISITLPSLPPATVHVTQPTSPPLPPQQQPTLAQHPSPPIPVVGPTPSLAQSGPTVAGPILSTQAPPPNPGTTLLEQIHSIPELGILSLHLSLPLFDNITQGILNQTTNPEGVADRITVFGPSNIGVLRSWRQMIAFQEALIILREGKCDPHELEHFAYMKSVYHKLDEFSASLYNNTRTRENGKLQQGTQHQKMLQEFMPQYHDMFNKANFTEEEQAFLRANLLYHIANSSIHLPGPGGPGIPHLSFPSTLMNDSRFVLLNSRSHPTPVESQRLELLESQQWNGHGQATIELRFGVPGRGYYKSRVYGEPWLHNILASNGILHVIDRVQVLPLNISATLWLADLTSALDVLNITGLLPRVDVTPNITIFVPSDEAMAYAYPYNQIKQNQTLLKHLIQHHIAAGVHYTKDFRDFSSPLVTYNNDTIMPRQYGINSYLIEDADIIVPNILFKNGVIHIIDKVLMTPALLGQSPEQLVSPYYPSQPFPLIPPFQSRPHAGTPSNIPCGAGDSICHIVNVVTNQTSPYPTCYNPSTHVCVNNSFLCPLSNPYACGVDCYDISKYQCQTVFADGALHYFLTQRATLYTPTPTPSQPKPAQAPPPTCPIGDQLCNIIDIRTSLTEAKPQCFNPYTHICSNNTFLCPVTHPFVCGFSCYHSTFYSCSYTFFNNTFQWMLIPTPLLTQLEAEKGQPTAAPAPTPTPTPAPAPAATTQPYLPQPQPYQPHQPQPQPQPQPYPQQPHHPQQPQPHQPTPYPQPHPTATPAPAPAPAPPPTHRPTAQPTTVKCPSGDAICQVSSPFLPPPSHPVPTCYNPRTHVCANATFLCPVSSPLLCDKHCYNATVFECVGNTLRLHSPTVQPRLSPHVAAHVFPRPLSPTTTTMTHLPSRVDLTTTLPSTVGPMTLTQSTYPSPIWVEVPSGQTNIPGTTVSRVVSMPAGAKVALVGEAQVSTVLEALMNLPDDVRKRLGLALTSHND